MVPDDGEIKRRIIQELHSTPYSAHPGIQRTIGRVRQSFYWKGMLGDIRQAVENCPVCNMRPRAVELHQLQLNCRHRFLREREVFTAVQNTALSQQRPRRAVPLISQGGTQKTESLTQHSTKVLTRSSKGLLHVLVASKNPAAPHHNVAHHRLYTVSIKLWQRIPDLSTATSSAEVLAKQLIGTCA